MAGTTDADKHALLAEIAATRVEMGAATERLRDAMDVPARLRRNVQEHRARWIGGAAALALAAVLLRRRKKIVYVERSTGDMLGAAGKAGFLLAGLKLAGTLARPLLGELAKARFLDLAARFNHARGRQAGEQSRHS